MVRQLGDGDPCADYDRVRFTDRLADFLDASLNHRYGHRRRDLTVVSGEHIMGKREIVFGVLTNASLEELSRLDTFLGETFPRRARTFLGA